jgi:hypothetical protein
MADPASPAPRVRKAARNEKRKALATTGNALSIAMLVTASLQPAFSGKTVGVSGAIGLAAFVALQGLAHYILRKVED